MANDTYYHTSGLIIFMMAYIYIMQYTVSVALFPGSPLPLYNITILYVRAILFTQNHYPERREGGAWERG